MSTEAGRRSYGMTDKGQVVVIEKVEFSDDGMSQTSLFEVRHGVRSVGLYDSETQAGNVAKALARAIKED